MHAVRQPQHLVQNEMKASPEMQATTKLMLVERPAPAPLDRKPALSMASIERVRSTSATLRRIENMQKLIGELSMHEMLADEIAWFLKFSPSGARKYIRDEVQRLPEAGSVGDLHVLVDVEVEVEVAVEGLLIISILGAKSVRAQKIQKEIQSAVVDKAVVTMAMVLTIDHVRLISTV